VGACFSVSDVVKLLGVTRKALRVWEDHGLVHPGRNASGYRVYTEDDLLRAFETWHLQSIGFSLDSVKSYFSVFERLESENRIPDDTPIAALYKDVSSIYARHKEKLEKQISRVFHRMDETLASLDFYSDAPTSWRVQDKTSQSANAAIINLPRPWKGERFELRDIQLLNYITGSLESGKTPLARRLFLSISGRACFIDASHAMHCRYDDSSPEPSAICQPIESRVDTVVANLIADGATESEALRNRIDSIERAIEARYDPLFIDDVENDLDLSTQRSLRRHFLALTKGGGPCLFLVTCSSVIVDLAAVGPNEKIIFCPSNHSSPICVLPQPGSPGYEALTMSLVSPDVDRNAFVLASAQQSRSKAQTR